MATPIAFGGQPISVLPSNLVIGAHGDTVREPYPVGHPAKVGCLLAVAFVYGLSFGLAVLRKSGSSFGGMFAMAFFLACALLVARETVSYEVYFDKTNRLISCSEKRLLTFWSSTVRTVRFDELAGDCVTLPDPSSAQCWCSAPTRSLFALRLKTGGLPVVVQRDHVSFSGARIAAWVQYVSNMSTATGV
jgi:hypothetical protein